MPRDLKSKRSIARLVTTRKVPSIRHVLYKAGPLNQRDVLNLLGDLGADLEPGQEDQGSQGGQGGQRGQRGYGHGDSESLGWQERKGLGAVLEDMPLSPLMHPELRKARLQHTQRKLFPSREKTEFQAALEKNPFGDFTSRAFLITDLLTSIPACMLTATVRSCALTGIRLPSFFHVQFSLRSHPNGSPWYLPTLLRPRKHEEQFWAKEEALRSKPTAEPVPEPSSQTIKSSAEIDAQRHIMSQKHESLKLTFSQSSPGSPPTTSEAAQPANDPTLAGTYITSQQIALKHIASLAPSQFLRHISFRWKSDPLVKNKLTRIVRRDDLDTFTLDLMRRRLLFQLCHYRISDQEDIQDLKSYGDLQKELEVMEERDAIGAVLWCGGEIYEKEVSKSPESISPPPYATIPYLGRQIPLYNLKTLLGEENLDRLRRLIEADPKRKVQFRSLASVKNNKYTVQCRLWLWKVMGYIGDGVDAEGERTRAESGAKGDEIGEVKE